MSKRPVDLPDLVGLKEIAERAGVNRNTIYSLRGRGDLPVEDATPSGIPVWRAARVFGPDGALLPGGTVVEDLPPMPHLVGTAEVAVAFGVERTTVMIWGDRQVPHMPEPIRIGGKPLWLGSQWLEFAKATRRPLVKRSLLL